MAWEAMAWLRMTWINQGQMSSADCSYYKSPVVIFHLFITSIFQRLITWPLKMNPNHIMPTSFRHNLEWAAQAFLTRSHHHFFWPGSQRKAKVDQPIAFCWCYFQEVGGEWEGCKRSLPSLLLRMLPPLDHWNPTVGETVIGLSPSANVTGICNAIPYGRRTLSLRKVEVGFWHWVGRKLC